MQAQAEARARVFCKIGDSTPFICKDCKHFVDKNEKCKLFGRVDIVTGRLHLEDARDCRSSSSVCGPFAMHFEQQGSHWYDQFELVNDISMHNKKAFNTFVFFTLYIIVYGSILLLILM